jgi:GT2 family glycosyltransferase
MPQTDPWLAIVIPNWNGRHLLEDCLDSLRRQSCHEFSVTVVDNGSTDGSAEWLGSAFPEVRCIVLPENRGFSAAVNAGIEQTSTPWVLLLNNDMEVDGDCIAALKNAVERYPQYDLLALKMLNFHQRSHLDGAGDGVIRGGAGYRLGTMEEDGPFYSSDRDVFGACAGAALYRRSLFERVGLFDEDFFAYLEDVDFNIRAQRNGCRCRYVAAARVYHIGSATSGSKFNPLTIRLSTRNSLNVLIKNYHAILFFKYLPVICIYQLAWLCFCIKKGLLIPYLQGLWDGCRGFSIMAGKRKLLTAAHIPLDQFDDILRWGERQAITSIMDRRREAGKGNLLLRIYDRLFI